MPESNGTSKRLVFRENYYFKTPLSLDEFYLYVQAELTAFHTAYSYKAKLDPENYPLFLNNYEEWAEQLSFWLLSQSEQY